MVNNAGMAARTPLLDDDSPTFDRTMAVTSFGVILGAQACGAPHEEKRRRAVSIVHVTSSAAQTRAAA